MKVTPAPWVAEVINKKRPIREEELGWMFRQLIAVMRLEDEFALRKFQSNLAQTLGNIEREKQ